MSRTTSKNTPRITFEQWYQERFNSDPMAALEYFASDADNISRDYGVDFHKTLGNIRLTAKDIKLRTGQIGWAAKGYKGKTAVYARYNEDKRNRNIRYPFITFQTYKGGQRSEVFNGYTFLWDLYRNESQIEISASERAKREQEKLDKETARKEREEKLIAKEKREEQQRQRKIQQDIEQFNSLGAAAPNHKYAKRKRISEATLNATANIRMGEDRNGKYLAFPLINIHRQIKGIQKIYEEEFKLTPDMDPSDKYYTSGMTRTGSFCTIGDVWGALERGDPIAFCEGYATGASWFAAMRQPVVVTLDSPNLPAVVNDFRNWYPDHPMDIAADNDQWTCEKGRGNAGLKAALELVKKYGKTLKAYFPNWESDELINLSDKPTDWNDVHLNHVNGLKGIRQMVGRKTNRLVAETKPFDYALQMLSYCNQWTTEKQARSAISHGMNLFPAQISGQQIYQYVFGAMAPALISDKLRKKLHDQIEWLIKKKKNTAIKLNGFSKETLEQDHIKYHSFNPVRKGPGWYEMPDNVLKMVRNLEGLIIVKAPMGSGKTQKLMKPLIHESDSAAYIAHRVSLVASACEKLSTENSAVDNYQNLNNEMMPNVRHMGTCINSAPYTKFATFFQNCDLVCIDEAKQTLSHITDGTIENPVQVYEFLQQIMNNTKRVVMCDADANDALISFCEQACPGQLIHVIEVGTDCSDFKVNFGTSELVYQSVIDAAKAGERCLVATDGAASGSDLAADIRTQVPGCRVLMVQRDTRGDKEVEAFQAKPDDESHKYDVVIYSPSISSGVSIENNYFTRHYGIFYGMVSPTDAVQMLRRDRFATEFTVGFKRVDSRKETDQQLIMLGKVLANQFIAGEDELKTRWHNFDFTWAAFAASERKANNDFANNMLLMLMANGYKVSRAEVNPIMEEKARHSKKLARQICEAEKIGLVMDEVTPSDDEAESIKRRDLISQSDSAKLTRHMIETELQVPVTPDTIRFVEDRGVSKVRRLERALSSSELANDYDSTLIKKGVVVTRRSNVSASKAIWDSVINHTGLNLKTGEGDFGAEQAKAAMESVLTDTSAIAMYNELNIGPYVNPNSKPADATKWVVAILERFGLKLKVKKVGQKKLRRHYLDADQHGFMMQFINNRQQAEINCLKITLTTDEEYAIATRYDTTETPPNPHDMAAGVCSSGGGAGQSVMYITENQQPAPDEIGEADAPNAIDLRGVNTEGVAMDLVRVAMDLDISIPETTGNAEMFLILLTVELQNRLAQAPDLLKDYPEINWIFNSQKRGAA